MAYGNIFHAFGLHLYQPPGNLLTLLNNNEGEAQQIIRCYDRITRYAHKYPNNAKLHLCFAGTLLEQLRNSQVVDRCRHFMDIPAMLESYRLAQNVEFLGSGYHHPIFPLIPTEDWEEQLISERQLIEDTFGRAPRGFYPAEMAFTMRMIPALVKAGYEYVVIDAAHVRPNSGPLDSFQVYRAYYNDVSIAIIPKDDETSQAQANGMEVYWFANAISHRVRASPHPEESRLLTTWSDGENSGWFRQEDHEGFFGKYFESYMAHVQSRRYPIKPVFISDFVSQHPSEHSAQVETCQWNQGDNLGYELPQWRGSAAQQQALAKIREASSRYYQLKKGSLSKEMSATLEKAHQQILESESSYFLYGGEEQISKLFEWLTTAEKLLTEVESAVKVASKVTTTPAKTVTDKPDVKTSDKPEVKTAANPPAEIKTTEKSEVKTAKPVDLGTVASPKTNEVTPVTETVVVKESSPSKVAPETGTSKSNGDKGSSASVMSPFSGKKK
jgi:alpha-amylase/alpha-mannosidase (GH57 family)